MQAAAAPASQPVRAALLATTALLPAALLAMPAAAQAPNAAPTGGQVSAGVATIGRAGNMTTINQDSARAAIDWQRFDVGRDHTVRFNQPNAQSWTLNRVNAPDPSLIAGRIQANGGVAIVNQSGVVFAPGAQVNVGSLIASAPGITNQNFMAGRMVFDQPARPGARVENHGNITVAERGLASLVAPGVANTGLIRARLGRVALAGAETFTLDLAGDGLVALDVTQSVRQAPQGAVALVTNSGTIEATGGSVLLTADAARGVVDSMLRNTGRIAADGDATVAAGRVALRGGAGGDVRVDAGSITAANAAPGGRGGSVELGSAGNAVRVAAGARLDASGAGGGGAVRVGGGDTAQAVVAGEVAARGTGARVRGGLVTVEAKEGVEVLAGAKLDASGSGGGGTVLAGTTGIGRAQQMAARTTVEAGAELRADATDAGDGGVIAVNSTDRTEVRGLLAARGGPNGGNGGFIELSGQHALHIAAEILLDAPAGRGGTVLLDPDTINLQGNGAANEPPAAGTPGRTTGAILFADGGTGTINVDVAAINGFTAGVDILLQANNTINVKAEVNRTTAGSLFLETGAGGTIDVNAHVRVQNGSLGFRTGTLDLANVTIAASSDITVSANTLKTKSGIVVSAPVVSLRADTFTLTDVNVLSGSTLVEIGPRSAGTAATAFVPANDVIISAGLLRLGRTAAGNRSWGSPDASEVTADNLVLSSAITRAGTNLELSATKTVELKAAIDLGSGTLTLTTNPAAFAAAAVSQQATGAAIAAGRVAGTAGSGGFSLPDPANALGSLGAISSTSDVTIRSAGNLGIVGAVSGGIAGVVRISAAGALDVAATGSVTAGDLGGTDSAPVAGTGQVHLWGSAVTLAGAVTGGAAVTLAASSDPATFVAGGAVSQSGAGSIRSGELAVLAGGDVALALATNRILSVGSASFGPGSTAIRSDRAMTVTSAPVSVPHPDGSGPTAPTAGIAAQGDVRLAAPSLTVDAALLAGGDATRGVTLVADAFSFGAPGLIQPGAALTPGTVTLTRLTDGVIDLGGAGAIAGALEIGGTELSAAAFASRLRIGGGFDAATLAPSGAGGTSVAVTAPLDLTALGIGTLDLRGSSVTQAASGAGISVGRLEATAGSGGLLLDGAGNVIAAVGDIAAGGTSTLRVDAGLVLDGAIDLGTNTLNLRSDGTVTQPGGTVTAALDIRGATGASAGAITLGRQNQLSAFSAASSAGITVRTERAAGLSIGAVSGATDIRVFSNDVGAGAISVDGAVTSTGAGTVRLETRAPLSVSATGSVTSGALGGADAGSVHLWGQSIALTGAVEGGSQVSLTALAGSIDNSFGSVLPATLTQSGAGLVSTRRLALLAAGNTTLDLANLVDSVGAFAGGDVTLRSTRNLSIAAGLAVPRADDLGLVSNGTGVQSLNGSIALSAPTVTIGNAVTADAGDIAVTAFGPGSTITLAGGTLDATAASRSITLTADSVDLGLVAAVTANAGSGTVVLQPFTNGASLLVNAASGLHLVTAGTLSLRSLGSGGAPAPGAVQLSGALSLASVGVLDLQGASVSQAGGSTLAVGAVTGATSGGNFLLNQPGNQIGTLGAVTAAGGVVNVANSTAMTVAGPVTGATGVALSAASLDVAGAVTATTGNVVLTATNGSIDVNAALAATAGSATLGATFGAIQIDAPVSAGLDILLTARDNIAQTAPGVLTANGVGSDLVATSFLGAVALAAAGNQVGAASGSANGAFDLRSVTALTLNGISGSAVGVAATSLTVAGSVTAGAGAAALTATTGALQLDAQVSGAAGVTLAAQTDIGQSAPGVLVAGGGAGALSATATTGQVALELANNRTGSVSGSAGAGFAFRSVTGLTAGSVAAGNGISLTGPSLAVSGPVVASSGNITLTAASGSIDVNGAVTATVGDVTMAAGSGAIQLDAAVTAGDDIFLSARDDVVQSAPGVLSATGGAGALAATSGSGAVALTAAGNRLGDVSGSGFVGFAVRSLDALAVGAVSAVFGPVQATGASLAVGGPVTNAFGDIALTATSGSIAVNGTVSTAPGLVALSALAGGIQVDATVNGGSGISLAAQNDIAQGASGVLTAGGFGGALNATSTAGAVSLTAAANAMGGIAGSAANGFAFRNTVGMTAGPVTAAGGGILLVAPSLNVSGLLQATAADAPVTLVADALTLAPNAIAAGSPADAGRVTVTRVNGGTLAVGGSNAPGVTAVDTAGIARADTLQVGGGFDAGSMSVSGNGNHAVTLAGASNLLGRADVLDLRGATVTQAAGTLAVGELQGTATAGDFLVNLAGNAISTLGPITANAGAVRVTSGVVLTAADTITARDEIALTATGLVVNGALNVTAGALSLTSTSGDLVVNTAIDAPNGAVNLAATSGGLEVDAPVTAGGDISLLALNDVSQTATGVLSANGGAGALAVQSTNGLVALTAADNLFGGISGGSGGAFAVRSIAGLAVGAVTAGGAVSITGPAITVNGNVLAGSGAVALEALTGNLDVNAAVAAGAGAVGLTADAGAIQLDAGVTAGTSITLAALNGIAQSAPGVLTANGGLLADSAAGGVALTLAGNQVGAVSGSAAGGFAVRSLAALTVNTVAAGAAVDIAGLSLIGSGTVTAATGDVRLAATGGAFALNQAVTATAGGVTLSGPGDVAINAPVTAGTGSVQASATSGRVLLGGRVEASAGIALAAGLSIEQSAGGLLVAAGGNGALAANATAGAVALNGASNQVGSVSGSAGGDFALSSATGLVVNGVTAAGGVNIVGPAVTLEAAVRANGGSAALRATSGDVVVDAALGAAGNVALAADMGGVQVNAAVTSGGTIALTAETSIGQGAAGVLTATGGAGALVAQSASGDVVLGLAANRVGGISGSAGGDFGFRSVTGLSVGTISAGGGLAIAGPALTVGGAVAANGGDLTLTSASGAITLNSPVAAAGNIGVNSAGDIRVNTAATAGADLVLSAQGSVTQAAAGVLAAGGGTGALQVQAASGTVALLGADNRVGTVAGSAGGDFAFRSITGLAVGSVTAGGAVTIVGPGLAVAGPVMANGGGATLVASSGDIAVDGGVSAGGAVEMDAAAGGIATSAPITAGTAARLSARGDILLGGPVAALGSGLEVTSGQGGIRFEAAASAAGDIILLARGDIGQGAAGAVTADGGAGTLIASSTAGAVDLGIADNAIGIVAGSAAAGFGFRGVTPLTVQGITTTSGDIAIRTAGSPVLLNGPLDSAAGILVAAGGGLTIPATTILARGGDAELRSGAGLAATDATVISPGTITLAADGSGAMLRLSRGSYTANHIVLTAGPAGDGTATASFSGGSFLLGTAMLVAAGGGVGLPTDLPATVTPQNPSELPLLFFDTRRSATALRGLDPAVFAPATRDDPTLVASDQTWQVLTTRRSLPAGVRVVGFADGSGAATSDPAGALAVNLDAGESGVFFLLDGGTASGTIFAGRLGVHGQPSNLRLDGDLVVDLTGELSGISGSAAARFGRVATSNPADQGRYRFDNCVLDTINCVVPSLAQPVVLPLSNRIDIRSDVPQLDPDVLLPNIAEEDY